MISKKFAFVATTALVGSLMAASGAYAQSTGTTEVESVVVTATKGQPTIDGVITAETQPKAKASIDQEFISTQATGQTIIQSLNLTPGLNFTNSDPYGSSGGNLRIRGFDGARISLTFDGIPLNDTGNYAIYTNQQLDPELVERASVSIGTTDVDSPTASAVGGTINYISRKPAADMGAMFNATVGSFNYRRVFGLVDSGEIGPYGTTMYVAGSYQKYDKFKGPGDLEKWQINAKIYQPIGDNGDFISLAIHYNQNRNNFYRTTTIANFEAFGRDYDNNASYLPIVSTPFGATTRDTDTDPSDNSNYYGVRINPSNTGNIRAQSKFTLSDSLTLTVDSAFQYTLANGGGSTTISETSATAYGSSTATSLNCTGVGTLVKGFDLNGDGDICDTVRFYSPNTTNTRRYTTLASLIWKLDDNNTIRAAYTYDYGNHRQTGAYGYLNNGEPQDVFGGKDGYGRKVLNADGYYIRGRDRQSFAILNQFSLEYRGRFMDDNLVVNLGVRAPFFKRELHQFCYTQLNSSTVRCTSETPTAVVGSTTKVTFASGGGTFIKPFNKDVKYDKVLPNIGISYQFLPGQTIYASYAEGLSAPRTDNLYTAGVDASDNVELTNVQPETSKAADLGYRFRSGTMIVSTALWANQFKNRIVTAFDPDLGFSVDRNVGDVKLWGVDGQVGFTPVQDWSIYFSGSYTHSELQDDLLLSSTPTYLPLKGKQLVETPEWQFGFRTQWQATEKLSIGFQGKHVGSRYTTDVNDEETPAYNVFDLDMRYDVPWFNDKGAYVQLNVTNLFDEEYYGTISSGQNANVIPDVNPGPAVTPKSANTAFVGIGAPRTVQLSFRTKF